MGAGSLICVLTPCPFDPIPAGPWGGAGQGLLVALPSPFKGLPGSTDAERAPGSTQAAPLSLPLARRTSSARGSPATQDRVAHLW